MFLYSIKFPIVFLCNRLCHVLCSRLFNGQEPPVLTFLFPDPHFSNKQGQRQYQFYAFGVETWGSGRSGDPRLTILHNSVLSKYSLIVVYASA